jgi:hypothetical protein
MDGRSNELIKLKKPCCRPLKKKKKTKKMLLDNNGGANLGIPSLN